MRFRPFLVLHWPLHNTLASAVEFTRSILMPSSELNLFMCDEYVSEEERERKMKSTCSGSCSDTSDKCLKLVKERSLCTIPYSILIDVHVQRAVSLEKCSWLQYLHNQVECHRANRLREERVAFSVALSLSPRRPDKVAHPANQCDTWVGEKNMTKPSTYHTHQCNYLPFNLWNVGYKGNLLRLNNSTVTFFFPFYSSVVNRGNKWARERNK